MLSKVLFKLSVTKNVKVKQR